MLTYKGVMVVTLENRTMKKLAICLYFRAPLGGLQENVLATARAAQNAGWQVTVLCPDGPFLNHYVLVNGIDGFGVDFSDSISTERAMQFLCDADVIHSHPGPSRNLALEAKRRTGNPLFFTIHGTWFDGVQQYAEDLAAIICVSQAVQEVVLSQCLDQSDRVFCIPNGIDYANFASQSRDMIEPGHVVVASRYDTDKRLVIDTLIALWQEQSARGLITSPRYTIAGHGTLLPELRVAAEALAISVDFAGWQSQAALAALYARAALVIASGRAAMESLACGRPTLALASVGAAVVFDEVQLKAASYSNFGGYGALPPVPPGELLDRILSTLNLLDSNFPARASAFIHQHHDNQVVNARLLELYEAALLKGSGVG
jgi:glycosyltransferase involved in cell wall biosynthesis